MLKTLKSKSLLNFNIFRRMGVDLYGITSMCMYVYNH
jgi:hypothetical protein